MSARMSEPKMHTMLSERAKAQWQDENYKSYMIEKWQEFYKGNEEYRRQKPNN